MEILDQLKKDARNERSFDKAADFLRKALNDEAVFFHCLRTGLLLKELGADEPTVLAGILQAAPDIDAVKDLLAAEIRDEVVFIIKKFEQIKDLALPKKELKSKPLAGWEKTFLDVQSQNLRRMFFAISQDLRPILIILAKSLDEMQNLEALCPAEMRIKKSLAALEILAPLAYGLGISEIKGQLEDAAFPYVFPQEYQWLVSAVRDEYSQKENYLEAMKTAVEEALANENIRAMIIQARAKHYFSLYQKLLRHDMDIEKIYDLVALRIIVPDIETCYRALGAVHKRWEALPGRIKDYISSPKNNGYRALHTSVIGEQNKFVEFQIKTPEMHQESEYGAVAHLSYKTKNIKEKTYRNQFYWLDQLRKWQEEIKEPGKIGQFVKSELFKDRVFVFTPKQDVINLPKGATPLDFAYAIHSQIGDHTESAIVDGKIAPFSQALTTGQTVEIITGKNKTPSLDWLKVVKSNQAKKKIRSFLEKAHGLSLKEVKKQHSREKRNFLLEKILPLRKKETKIMVGGASGIMARVSKCCSPKPGDALSAFITQGEGASVHKTDCPNLKELAEKWPERVLAASWPKP
ncbi:MAG: HD domain-containing protein [Candidatus Pacebacteria bacterium]|nr:HD domain-containing protein [Candidatus Paceibacterota bacterium]